MAIKTIVVAGIVQVLSRLVFVRLERRYALTCIRHWHLKVMLIVRYILYFISLWGLEPSSTPFELYRIQMKYALS